MHITYFNDIIKKYKYIHKDMNDYSDALLYFINSTYDIMSFNSSLSLEPGDTILMVRDFISDIKSDIDIYYVFNDKQYLIDSSTRLLTFLTPLNPIFLRNLSDKVQVINFKRWLIKLDIVEDMTYQTICDNHLYYYGTIKECDCHKCNSEISTFI